MIKAIIFDCFGVVLADALSVMTGDLAVQDPQAFERVRALLAQANMGQATADESSKQIATIFGMSYPQYRKHLQDGEVKDQALLDYIAELRGTYKTAMLSNIPKDSLKRRFAEGELEQYFDVVVASGEIGYAKPQAQAYEITADRLGVRLDECLFTDDREPYCEGAAGAGMQTIVYTSLLQFRTDLAKLL